MSGITTTTTYHEVNIDRYSELQYGDAKLFTNGDGDVVLTLESATADQLNSCLLYTSPSPRD